MKAEIKDKVWTRLSELLPRDVDDATATRIRERALGALRARPPSAIAVLARRIERIWTDFVELPMVGGVIVACLFWLVQGMAWGRSGPGTDRANAPHGEASTITARRGPFREVARAHPPRVPGAVPARAEASAVPRRR